ncbi:uncharacterized protein METZ01_LOCUS223631 [marine metagenome]|uniref:Uncharacterized protein n=1 Tax=marine metagenome TaxID=408172 RepID=A0A382G884_9ZZZZ
MKTQLLCTFAKKNSLNEIIDIIISCNKVLFDKIYVFENAQELANLICTYNVEFETDFMEGIPNTISLHRKKHTNTLYTINALNKIILQLNNGVLDKRFPVPWKDYRNCILLYNDDKLVEIKTKIYKIVKVSEWAEPD